MRSNREVEYLTDTLLIALAVGIMACGSISFLAPTPTVTPILTPTPQFIRLPPLESLTDLIAIETGPGFHYLPQYYIPDDTIVWLLFGWLEEDLLYKAVFVVEGDEWVLLAVEKMGDETLPPSTMETDNGLNN